MAKDLENTMVGNNVYLLTEINQETTNGLIIQLTQWVNSLPIIKQNKPKKIYTPYEEIPNDIPVLNVWINCWGGKSGLRQSMSTLFDIASAHGTIIKTYNLREASSSASIIAVSGTKGYRYMSEHAFNMIHFGSISQSVKHPNEIEYVTAFLKRHGDETFDMYTKHTKLTEKELDKFQNQEGSGLLNPEQCLHKGLCDWIITDDGRFVNNIKDIKTR